MYLAVQIKVLKWADKVASTCVRRPADEFFWGKSLDDNYMWIFTQYWGVRLPKNRVYIDVDAVQLKCSGVMRRTEESLLFEAKPVATLDRYITIIRHGQKKAPELMVLEAETGEKVYVDCRQIKNAGIKDIDEFEIRIIDYKSPVGFFQDGELVACVLPTRVKEVDDGRKK